MRIRILLFSSLTFNMPTKNNLKTKFFWLLLFEGTLTSFSNLKSHKKSQRSRSQGFSYYFCLVIEGSGSIPMTIGSGSGSNRPKNIRIWRIRIRIRIRNTGLQVYTLLLFTMADREGYTMHTAQCTLLECWWWKRIFRRQSQSRTSGHGSARNCSAMFFS